jgi:hypothetical protein
MDDQGEAPPSFKRNPDDLRMYDTFFPELFDIEVGLVLIHLRCAWFDPEQSSNS